MTVQSEPIEAADRDVIPVEFDLSRPLSADLVEGLNKACARVVDSPTPVLLLRLTGASPRPAGWPGPADVYLVNKWEGALRRLERLSAFTVGVLDGHCTQGALELLLVTDKRVASAHSTIAPSGRGHGMWPGVGLHRLVHQIGLAEARRLTLLPRDLDARALLASGVLDSVEADLDSAIGEITEAMSGVDGAEVAMRRQLLLDAVTVEFEEALGSHLAACDRVLRRAGAAAGGA
jgi:isomerase DpgB